MDMSLRAFLENNEFQNDEREQLIESIAAYKSRLKKMKQNYESMTPERYEEDKQKLKTRIEKLEQKINDTVKIFQEVGIKDPEFKIERNSITRNQENLTVPLDKPLVDKNENDVPTTVPKIKSRKKKSA